MIKNKSAPCNLKPNRIKADKLLQAWLRTIPGVTESIVGGSAASVCNGWPIDCPEFTLQTDLGVLKVMPASSHGGTGYCVYGCFYEPKRAAAVIGRANMNDYSGKWNHHSFAGDNLTPEQFAAFISHEIHDHCLSQCTPLQLPGSMVIVGKRVVAYE